MFYGIFIISGFNPLSLLLQYRAYRSSLKIVFSNIIKHNRLIEAIKSYLKLKQDPVKQYSKLPQESRVLKNCECGYNLVAGVNSK